MVHQGTPPPRAITVDHRRGGIRTNHVTLSSEELGPVSETPVQYDTTAQRRDLVNLDTPPSPPPTTALSLQSALRGTAHSGMQDGSRVGNRVAGLDNVPGTMDSKPPTKQHVYMASCGHSCTQAQSLVSRSGRTGERRWTDPARPPADEAGNGRRDSSPSTTTAAFPEGGRGPATLPRPPPHGGSPHTVGIAYKTQHQPLLLGMLLHSAPAGLTALLRHKTLPTIY
ncbi:unnamed protein product [Gadus morhua 'NCC']